MTVMKWGILGASKFAREHMAPAIHAASGAELFALATGSPDKAAGFRAFCPSLKVHETYEDLLSDPEVDAVYIPLPNHMHVDWSIKAAKAGKHVLCEKPVAMQASEFDQLIEARDTSGKLVAEAYMIVHHPQWHFVRDLVQGGAIGKLSHISGRFSFDNREETENIRNRPETGGGALRDIGVYVLGSARFVTGMEGDVISAAIRWENDVDAYTNIHARFGQTEYTAYISTRMYPAQEMVFHGDKGMVRVTVPFNARVFGEPLVELHSLSPEGETATTLHRFPRDDHYQLQVEAFGRSAATGEPYGCPLEFSRGTQAMIDRIFEVSVSL